jgi:hypothetical protein
MRVGWLLYGMGGALLQNLVHIGKAPVYTNPENV